MHRQPFEYANADGEMVKSVQHRAGWDATFSPPKSVSLTALVGGDDRIRAAHGEAVTIALTELERYTQARIGGNRPAETTGQFIAAKFEHDLSRPVDGYAAPQLHTHAVIFNVTERENGQTRALQEHGYFDTQQFATAVYQSELTFRLRQLGYEIEAGRSGAPEVKGSHWNIWTPTANAVSRYGNTCERMASPARKRRRLPPTPRAGES